MTPEEKKAHDEAVAKATEANRNKNNERLAKMEAIADGADQHREADFDDALEIKDDAEDRERRAIAEDEEAARLLQTEGASEESSKSVEEVTGDTKVVNGVTYYLQIVNGREKWQSLAEIRQSASKVEAADEYLRTAAESVKNASRLALSKQDEPASFGKDEVKRLLASAALGDEDAIERLASVISTRPSEPSDVLRQIDQRLSFRTELASLEAKSKDLLENPYMGRLFRDRLNELKAENPTMGLAEAYTSIDTELRKAFPGVTKARTQDKLERKRTLVNVPTAAARQVREEDEEGEEDVGNVIEQMAKARGLSPHVHSRRN
jgi:hypothetical protein